MMPDILKKRQIHFLLLYRQFPKHFFCIPMTSWKQWGCRLCRTCRTASPDQLQSSRAKLSHRTIGLHVPCLISRQIIKWLWAELSATHTKCNFGLHSLWIISLNFTKAIHFTLRNTNVTITQQKHHQSFPPQPNTFAPQFDLWISR